MSDREVAQLTRAPHISAIASGKLRSLGGQTSLFAETDGLVDAFSEVFASIAAATPPIEAKRESNDANQVNALNEGSESAEVEQHQSDSADDTEQQDFSAIESVVVQTKQNDAVVTSVSDAIADSPEAISAAEAYDELSQHDSTASEIATLVEAAPVQAETDTPVAQISLTDDSTKRQRRTDSNSIETPASNPQQQLPDHDSSTVESARAVEVVNNRETGIAISSEGQDLRDQAGGDSERRNSRRGKRDSQEPSAVTKPAAGHEAARPLTKANELDPSGLQPPQSVVKSEAAPALPKVVVEEANAAAVVARVDATSGAAQARTPNRGVAPTLEPAGALRTDSKAGPADAARQHDKANASTAETVSRVKLVQRVSRAFQHLGLEGGVIRLRLAPDELGSVQVEMRIEQRHVQARVIAETEATSAALREHLPDLRARLESFGMQVESIEIETQSNEQQHSSAFSNGGFQQHSGDRENRKWRGRDVERTAVVSPQVSPLVRNSVPQVTAGVDIRF
jgi:flagellar hook-length control protein FliK